MRFINSIYRLNVNSSIATRLPIVDRRTVMTLDCVDDDLCPDFDRLAKLRSICKIDVTHAHAKAYGTTSWVTIAAANENIIRHWCAVKIRVQTTRKLRWFRRSVGTVVKSFWTYRCRPSLPTPSERRRIAEKTVIRFVCIRTKNLADGLFMQHQGRR